MAAFQERIADSKSVNNDEIAQIVFNQMAGFRARIAAIDERSRKNREATKKTFKRMLIIAVSIYVIMNLIALLILKYAVFK